MNMKAAASLTGSLLARKGAAYPAAYSAPSGAPSPDSPDSTDSTDSNASGGSQPERAYNDPRVIASAPPPAAAVESPQMQDSQFAPDAPDAPEIDQAPAAAAEESLSIPQVMDKMGRVRLSVRLDPDRYLRVKMASARTRWSAQDIVIAALDRYLGGSAGNSAEDESVEAEDSGNDEGSLN